MKGREITETIPEQKQLSMKYAYESVAAAEVKQKNPRGGD